MGGDNYIVDLVISQESSWLAEFCADKQAEGSSDYASSGAEDEVKGANIFMVS